MAQSNSNTNLAVRSYGNDQDDLLDRLRKEAFAVAYVHTGTLRHALKAGYFAMHDMILGAKLLRDPYVREKIQEERAFLEASYYVNKSSIHAQLCSDRELAYADGNASAAVAATLAQAKTAGLLVEEKDNRPRNITIRVDPALC